MIGLLERNLSALSISSVVVLYKCMVESHLDYCNSVRAPYKEGDMDMEDLEKVRKRATRFLPALRIKTEL